MNDTLALALESNQGRQPAADTGSAESSTRRYTPAALRDLIATWRERTYFRRELQRLLKDNPELIDDIGLTRRQVGAEIAKPFWQA